MSKGSGGMGYEEIVVIDEEIVVIDLVQLK